MRETVLGLSGVSARASYRHSRGISNLRPHPHCISAWGLLGKVGSTNSYSGGHGLPPGSPSRPRHSFLQLSEVRAVDGPQPRPSPELSNTLYREKLPLPRLPFSQGYTSPWSSPHQGLVEVPCLESNFPLSKPLCVWQFVKTVSTNFCHYVPASRDLVIQASESRNLQALSAQGSTPFCTDSSDFHLILSGEQRFPGVVDHPFSNRSVMSFLEHFRCLMEEGWAGFRLSCILPHCPAICPDIERIHLRLRPELMKETEDCPTS